jgi:hypothetical protein
MREYYNKVSTIRVSVGVSSIVERGTQCPEVSVPLAQLMNWRPLDPLT